MKPPKILSSAAAQAARKKISGVLDLDEDKRAQRRISINESLFKRDVPEALENLFLGKCAYCETPVTRYDRFAVDHFRPKHNAAQASGRTSLHHYAWLVYEWENLYLACQDCRRFKRNQFPVDGARAPLNKPISEIQRVEKGAIVDPCVDFPHEHFTFTWDGACRAVTERGALTLKVLRLDTRQRLHIERKKSFRQMLEMLEAPTFSPRRLIDGPLADSSPFSGAARILLFRALEEIAPRVKLEPPPFEKLLDALPLVLDKVPRKYWARAKGVGRATGLPPPVTKERARRRLASSASSLNELQNRKAATLRLAWIDIKNFKAINHLRFEIPEKSEETENAPCLMLLGENATGKSSILEALALTLLGTAGIRRLDVKAEEFRRRSYGKSARPSPRRPLTIEICFHGLDEPLRLELGPASRQFKGSPGPAVVLLGYGPHRYFAKASADRSDQPWERIASLFHPTATIPNPAEWLRRVDKGKGKGTFLPVARALREILLLRNQDDLSRDRKGQVLIRAYGQFTPMERLSEGYRSMLVMAVDVMREMLSHWDNLEEARGIVLIDEIETHLHPRWKMQVMGALRRAMPHVQFIVTTHDPLCLRGMADGEVHVLVRDARGRIEPLQDLPSIKGLRAEQLLTSDYFGLASTVDPETELDLAAYAALLSKRAAGLSEAEQANLTDGNLRSCWGRPLLLC